MSKKSKAHQEEVPVVQVFDPNYHVKLVSYDNHVFYIDRNCAKVSKLIRQCLSGDKPLPGQFDTSEAATLVEAANPELGVLATIKFNFLTAEKLEKGIHFMHYKYRYDHEAPDHRPAAVPGLSTTPQGGEAGGSAAAAVPTMAEQIETMTLANLLQI